MVGHVRVVLGIRATEDTVDAEGAPRLCDKWFALNFSFQSDPLLQYQPRDRVLMDPGSKGLGRAGEAPLVCTGGVPSANNAGALVPSDSISPPTSGFGCSRSLGILTLLSGVAVRNVTRCCHKLLPLIVFSGMISAIIASCRASHVSLLETMLLGGGCSSSSSAQDQFQLPAVTFWKRGLSRTFSPPSDFSVTFRRYDSRWPRDSSPSLRASFRLRSRSLLILFKVPENLSSYLCFPWRYRLSERSETAPTTSAASWSAGKSASDSKGRMTPRIETLSRMKFVSSCVDEL